MPPKKAVTISLERLDVDTAEISIVGTSPLIVNAWSERAKEQIRQKQQTRTRTTQRELKDPEQDFEDSRYQFADGSGDGFPTLAFQRATVEAARMFPDVSMVELKQKLYFVADGVGTRGEPLTRLHASEPRIREDTVRIGNGIADLRYRAEYEKWSCQLTVQFMPIQIDYPSILALVDAGGMGGIGEWRPVHNGIFGRYQVVEEEPQA